MVKKTCRRCGFEIVAYSTKASDVKARERGFCTRSCEEVDDAIMEDLKHQAEKEMQNG